MRLKILLAGGTGTIGKSLIHALTPEYDIYTMSKYPKKHSNSQVTWIKGDIYNYYDVLQAMEGMDIAVFFIDPTKHSAKMTRALAKELNIIAADNFGRAAQACDIKEILYVRGSKFDQETIMQLQSHGVHVRATSKRINRPHISVEFQAAKYDDIRIAHHIPKPPHWDLNILINEMSRWLSQTTGTRVKIVREDNHFKFYKKKNNKLLFIFELERIDQHFFRLVTIESTISYTKEGKRACIEFRYIPQFNWVIVHLYDYIPKVLWPIAYMLQVPFYQMLIRGFDTKCRIQTLQHRQLNGELTSYTEKDKE
ncbi:NAD(P)H-binding protein [Staphylococcus ratti]|uniref:NAD(P)H-binding protein n=1 Tax=Staphylococcus ratti TaxID=2892440 RepID=A0ABY3PBY3_9STAP|nr:NAD(P)H-binding protein [Staphylococcus ratti]UEX89823.1 NAD(P)H-binding protein [Staphylococcus ratti]